MTSFDVLVAGTGGGRAEGGKEYLVLTSVKHFPCLIACHLFSVPLGRDLATTCTRRDNSPSPLLLSIPLFWFVNSCQQNTVFYRVCVTRWYLYCFLQAVQ